MPLKIVIATAFITLLIVLVVAVKSMARRRSARSRAMASIQHSRLLRAAHHTAEPLEVELDNLDVEFDDEDDVAEPEEKNYKQALEEFDIVNP